MIFKRWIKKIVYGSKADSDTYIQHLKKVGMSIGERVTIYDPRNTCIDETRPYLINIGNDVKITRGVTILTHGYDWSVLAGMHDVVLGSAGEVTIGDNVFIGMNSIILKGVHVGSNVVIGAGSLVNKDIPDNVVVAGNPAKVIMSLDDYYEKRIKSQVEEACELYNCYVERFGKEPPIETFDEFFFLFWKKDEELPMRFKRQMSHHSRFEETFINLTKSVSTFYGYNDFLCYARKRKNMEEFL